MHELLLPALWEVVPCHTCDNAGWNARYVTLQQIVPANASSVTCGVRLLGHLLLYIPSQCVVQM
jgi:hypothetical protein